MQGVLHGTADEAVSGAPRLLPSPGGYISCTPWGRALTAKTVPAALSPDPVNLGSLLVVGRAAGVCGPLPCADGDQPQGQPGHSHDLAFVPDPGAGGSASCLDAATVALPPLLSLLGAVLPSVALGSLSALWASVSLGDSAC